MANVPEPTYEYVIQRLVEAYKTATGRIKRELERLDLDSLSRANAEAALAEIARILSELNDESASWVEEHLTKAATDGIINAILATGAAATVAEAAEIVKFNRMNTNMIAAAIADTQADLLAVTQNVDRRVRSAVRQAVAESMRANMAAGINGRRTINRETLAAMRRSLGDTVNTGIIDAAGRRWKPEVYVDMVTRTKMMEAYREATTNEAVQRGVLHARISRHGATDACSRWEGRIIKLVDDAPGDYPTYSQAKATREIWHPNCRHTFSPIRL